MCDGWEFDDYLGVPRHECHGRLERNHTLMNKRKMQGVKGDRRWFEQPINISMLCQAYHNAFGETAPFREFWQRRQAKVYGMVAVVNFLMCGPNKVKTLPLFDLGGKP